jgi:hypothetical protein
VRIDLIDDFDEWPCSESCAEARSDRVSIDKGKAVDIAAAPEASPD